MNEWIKVNNNDAINLALSMYVGSVCTKCGHKFSSVKDIKDRKVVCSKKDENGLGFACKKCFVKREEIGK